VALGINGKMNEVSAALGLLQIKTVHGVLKKRAEIDAAYRERLLDIQGLWCIPKLHQRVSNYAYFPILVQPDYPCSRDALYYKLKEHNVHTRRYFYPLISDLPMYRDLSSADRANLPVAASLSERVLCLPIYPGLAVADIERIVSVLARA